ncbi:MAG: hypothetical protein Q9M11_02700 [Mariprofundaceae bacterium]|nr:hypothetical protein [Mariprofundaceae bacterium]
MKHSFDHLIWLYDIALLTETIQDHKWHNILEAIHEYRLERLCSR